MKKIYIYFIVMIFFTLQIRAQNFVNGNFEQGPSSGWTQYSKGGYGLIGTAQFFYSTEITPQVFPRSGQYMARIGGFSYEENYIKQTVTLPNTPKVYMGLYYQDRASTTSECAGLWVGAQIRVMVAGQTILDQYICYYNTVNNWTYVYFDLSSSAGQTVDIGFRADAANSVWSYLYLDDISISSSLTGIANNTSLPIEFKLGQNYPNPFNPSTTIVYEIPKRSVVTLIVYDILGREIESLVNEEKQPGRYNVRFDAKKLSSGIYFYRLNTGEFTMVKRMSFIK